MSKRVFVTGMGALASTGLTVEDVWLAVKEGRSGIDKITRFDVSEWLYPLGAEIKDFKPKQLIKDKKLLKLISPHDVMGINAATQAVEDAQLITFRDTLKEAKIFNEKTGVYVGSPGNKFYQQYDFMSLLAEAKGDMAYFGEHLFEQVHPMWLLRILPNNVLAYTGIQCGFKGANQNITNHVVSGMQAVIEAYYAILSGQIDRAVVVAYDLGFEGQSLMYYSQLGIISKTGLKPFDRSHDGTILGEGAAAIVLESEKSALVREAHCYAEVLGGTSSSDAMGIFSLDENANALTDTFRQVLTKAKVNASDVGMVVAHANGTVKSDSSEAKAITSVFNNTPTTGFKWSLGHTLCASGLLDTVLSIKAMKEGIVPGIKNLDEIDTLCGNLSATKEDRALDNALALLSCRAFGGINSAVLLKAVAHS